MKYLPVMLLAVVVSCLLLGCGGGGGGGDSEEAKIAKEIDALNKEMVDLLKDPLANAGKIVQLGEKTQAISTRIAALPKDKQKALTEKLAAIKK